MTQAPAKVRNLTDEALQKLRALLDQVKVPGYNGDVILRFDVADGKIRSFRVGREEAVRL